jgi:probable F420-dependent oxidoreductase
VQIGVVFPQQEISGDPAAVRRYVTAIENLGYDHLVVYDHVLGAVHADRTPELAAPVDEHSPFSDPFVLFGYVAGLTKRIGFMTGVLILPQRQTVLVAKQAADVDLLSSGRLRLGVGVGWNHVEYEALGQDFRTRGARQEEQIDLLRQLWADPVVDFAGRFDRVDRAALVPKPSRPIPIWLGGSGDKAFDRAARHGDGFIFFNPGGVDGAVEAWYALRGRLSEAGRSVEDFGAEHVVLSHGVDAVTTDIATWRQAGGTHASISTSGVGSDSVEDHINYLAAIAAALN